MSTPQPAPRERVHIRATVKAAWRLVRDNPRATILPSLLIPVPVALVVAVVTAVLYMTAFRDDSFKPTFAQIDGDDSAGLMFLLILGAAVQGLFAQVARGATVAVAWGILTKRPVTTVAALDTAFTRMGALLLMAVIVFGGIALLVVSVVGIVLVPFVVARTAVSFETLIVENTSVGAALRQAWRASQGHVLRILGVMLLGALTALPIYLVVGLLESFVTGSRTQEVVVSGVVAVVQAILMAPLLAFFTALTTLLYFNLREGDDGRRPV